MHLCMRKLMYSLTPSVASAEHARAQQQRIQLQRAFKLLISEVLCMLAALRWISQHLMLWIV